MHRVARIFTLVLIGLVLLTAIVSHWYVAGTQIPWVTLETDPAGLWVRWSPWYGGWDLRADRAEPSPGFTYLLPDGLIFPARDVSILLPWLWLMVGSALVSWGLCRLTRRNAKRRAFPVSAGGPS